MKRLAGVLLAVGMAAPLYAATSQTTGPQLFCHRTANEDVPENTLESLEQGALLGCDVVEIDLRRTQDGEIVLNHDGILERLTDGVGEVKSSDYVALEELDLGTWMSPRFEGMRIARFADALRIARAYKIRLVLDIKEKGIGVDVLRILDQEGMRDSVMFGGEWEDVKKLMLSAKTAGDSTAWVQPGVSTDTVREQHRIGKTVVANFSANDHGMDLAGMRAAVAAGVDAINVDYPRLGADAVGRSVEEKLRALILKASNEESDSRAEAILKLARYQGFPLEEHFVHWLADCNPRVSRAAAEALVMEHPRPAPEALASVLLSPDASARANTAWVLGILHAPVQMLVPLLNDKDPAVLKAALLATASMPGEVSVSQLLALLTSDVQEVRGAAARALAAHHPAAAVKPIAAQLDKEVAAERIIYDDRLRRGESTFTQSEIDAITHSFRCQMEMVRALYSIPGEAATRELVHLALRPEKDFSQYNAIVASFQLWDRIALDPKYLLEVLGSKNIDLADRAEWTLAHAGPSVLPGVRAVLQSANAAARMRAVHILAWQADKASLAALQAIADGQSSDAALAAWAVEKIKNLHPVLQK
jgi:glycerophosphoryl diester phosphodiesterase